MSSRPAFQLKNLLAIYNVICIFLAGYVFGGVMLLKYEKLGTFSCNVTDTSDRSLRYAHFYYIFYIQKFWEFLDTWFFILRKSFRQVTFLHLFHHSSITLVVGFILRFDFAGDVYLPIVLNSFIHVLMYSHYLVTSLGMKSWWSQYLTSLQLIQFLMIALQSYIAWTSGPTCGYDFVKAILIVYMASMLLLFGNFFVQKYLNPPSKLKDH